MSEPRLRPAAEADAAALARNLVEGFGEYRAFAGPGWEPPPLAEARERAAEVIARPDAWYLVAEAAGDVAGQVAFMPAAGAGLHPHADPALAHLGQLFVRRPWWGTGLATRLLGAATAEAAERGFERMRLFVAAGYGRACRFYEREGFAPAGEPFAEPALGGLAIVEYRRELRR